MFEKLSQFAEQAATNVSRRQFFGRLGHCALVAVAAMSGLLALPAISEGAKRPPKVCDGLSYTGCVGREVGSLCSDGREGGTGRCRAPRGSTTCYCG